MNETQEFVVKMIRNHPGCQIDFLYNHCKDTFPGCHVPTLLEDLLQKRWIVAITVAVSHDNKIRAYYFPINSTIVL